uniref:Uncharacterized protein n=1 Tax=Vespula pensylvanica TaxID=30213 RepID=A0A834P621_VESPE|nr:hypothetical protein H0235_006061 [Vespula pensylvanica]
MRGSREEGRVSLEEEKNNAQSHMEECGPSGPESPSSVPHRIVLFRKGIVDSQSRQTGFNRVESSLHNTGFPIGTIDLGLS